MNKNIKFIIILAIIFAVIFTISYFSSINTSVSKDGEDKVFVVASGEGVNQISNNLFEDNLITSKFYFETYVWKEDMEASLQAGEYILSPSLNIKEIVDILVAGGSAGKEMTIKIIEGWDTKDIAEYLENSNIMKADNFLKVVESPSAFSSQFSFLADRPRGYDLEGYLFPDTYRIYRDASAKEIIEKMLFNFDKKLTKQMRADIESQGKSVYEIITMASIVEKEIRTFDDMKVVAGLFWDRITNGQALESCASLAYILGVNKPQYTLEDTKIDSPYNTYENRGLPPGPISNPSLNAIKASIYPKYTEYNYFLSDPKTGKTIFSKTFDEHINNKAKYLR